MKKAVCIIISILTFAITLSGCSGSSAGGEVYEDMKTGFDIYYNNYDIHELPPLK